MYRRNRKSQVKIHKKTLIIVTFPAKSKIHRVFSILPDEKKNLKKINHSEGAENIDFKVIIVYLNNPR